MSTKRPLHRRANPAGARPRVHPSAYIDPAATLIGTVTVGRNAFVGPGAVLRADEPGSAIVIADDCNVQDRVIVHALAGSRVTVGDRSSLSHGCIVHGPCAIGKDCFVGFGSVVFGATLADRVFVKHLAVVENAALRAGTVVPSRAVRRGTAKDAPAAFARKVVAMNLSLVKGYTGRS